MRKTVREILIQTLTFVERVDQILRKYFNTETKLYELI